MRMIDQIRASKLPSNMMQFAARGALQVPPAENIEILVYLARHNKIFGDTARMTLAGWDEKACLAAASNPQTNGEVLVYLVSSDNLRINLLPALLENPSVPEGEVAKLALSALRETADIILRSERAKSMPAVVAALKSNPYLKKEETEALGKILKPAEAPTVPAPSHGVPAEPQPAPEGALAHSDAETLEANKPAPALEAGSDDEEQVI